MSVHQPPGRGFERVEQELSAVGLDTIIANNTHLREKQAQVPAHGCRCWRPDLRGAVIRNLNKAARQLQCISGATLRGKASTSRLCTRLIRTAPTLPCG